MTQPLKVVYSAPNRAHHYAYARELCQAGILKAFVSGFSRLSPRSPIPEIGSALRRVDHVATAYLASMKLNLPRFVSEELAYRSHIQIDRSSAAVLQNANVFLFYNGCGLESARQFRRNGGIGIVEAVNSHVTVQEQLLAEEHQSLGIPWHPFHSRHVKRRLAEVEEADYVLLPSTFVAKSFIAKGFPADRLLKVPFPIQKIAGATEPSRLNETSDGSFRVLFVGAVSVRKGLRYLIEAFRQLKHPKKELWIVGSVTKPSGLEGVSLPEETKFLGVLKGDALQEIYRRATVFCLPSIEEGLALVLIEALSYGLPVIATRNTGIEDLVTDERGAMVVPIRDARKIGVWLNQLAENADLLKQKQVEAIEAAARLAHDSPTQSRLASTLLKAIGFQRRFVDASENA